MRNTGGSRFLPADASRGMLARQIAAQLEDLEAWAGRTGRVLDPAAVSVETRRIADGRVCVTVSADLVERAAPDQ